MSGELTKWPWLYKPNIFLFLFLQLMPFSYCFIVNHNNVCLCLWPDSTHKISHPPPEIHRTVIFELVNYLVLLWVLHFYFGSDDVSLTPLKAPDPEFQQKIGDQTRKAQVCLSDTDVETKTCSLSVTFTLCVICTNLLVHSSTFTTFVFIVIVKWLMFEAYSSVSH